MVYNKKAVSPLIATVLLVMITVSIGAAVMVVIQGLNDKGTEATEAGMQAIKCGTDVRVEVFKVDSSYQICLSNNGTFAIRLENKGTTDVSDFRFTVIGDDIYDKNGGLPPLNRGNFLTLKFTNINQSIMDSAVKIRLSPKIPGGPTGKLIVCEDSNLEWDSQMLSQFKNCNETTTTWEDSTPSSD